MRPARRRIALFAMIVASTVLTSQLFGAQAAETSTVNVVVGRLDSSGFQTAVTLNEFTRTYDGSGSSDAAHASSLPLKNGLVSVGGNQRALPIVVRTHYFLDGVETTPREMAGKSGAFRVEWVVTNRTQRTETVTYTDSTTGAEQTVTAATVVPFTVALTDLDLPDTVFDALTSNGIVARSDDDKSTALSWTAVLAPPVFPGSAVFEVEGRTSSFKLPGAVIVATPGVSGALPTSASDAAEKGGATSATLRGYVTKFGDGFGQLSSGLGQLKGGVDQIFSGLNNTLKPGLKSPTFDAALYAEDSSLAKNQPGLVQALQILGDGLGSLVKGAAQVRGGLKTGSAANPGVLEGLNQIIAGIGQGNEFDGSGNPLTVRASLNAIRVGLSSGDASAPGIVEGLQKIVASIGAGNEVDGSGNPLTIRAIAQRGPRCAVVGRRRQSEDHRRPREDLHVDR